MMVFAIHQLLAKIEGKADSLTGLLATNENLTTQFNDIDQNLTTWSTFFRLSPKYPPGRFIEANKGLEITFSTVHNILGS